MRSPYLSLLLVFAFLTLSLCIAGYLSYDRQVASIKQEQWNKLTPIADLKAAQLTSWRKERWDDADFILDNPVIAGRIGQLYDYRNASAVRKEVHDWMSSLFANRNYRSIRIVGEGGDLLLSLPDTVSPLSTQARAFVDDAISLQETLFSDIFEDQGHNVRLEIVIPVSTRTQKNLRKQCAVVLEVDPRVILDPLVQSWPVSSRTSESLLIRPEGDEVVYLSTLRHRRDAPLALRLPIGEESIPEILAAQGIEGIFEGVDYRKVPVLAAIRRVPNSNWSLVVKTDQDEIYSPIQRAAWYTGTMVGLLILAALLGVGLVWQRYSAKMEHRKHEAELERRALVRHYEYLTKHAHDIIILLNPAGRIVETNDSAMGAYGYTRTELLRLSLVDLQAPETARDVTARIEQLKKQKGFAFESQHRRKDGSIFPVEVSLHVIQIDGKAFFQGIIRDITERKESERSLLESERRFSEMLRSVKLAAVMLDADGNVTFCNDFLLRLTGWAKEEIIGENWFEKCLPLVEQQPTRSLFLKAIGSGDLPAQHENWILTRGGDQRLISWNNTLLRDNRGIIIGTTSIGEDVTERREADKKLRDSETKFRELADLLPQTVFEMDATGKLTFANRHAFLAFQYEPSDLEGGLNVMQMLVPEDRERAKNNILQVMNREESAGTEYTALRRNGETFPILTYTSAIVHEDKAAGVRGIIVDITDRKRVEEQVRQGEEMFRLITENAADLIAVLDLEGKRLYNSPSYLELLGDPEQLRGTDSFQEIHPDDRERITAVFHETVSSGIGQRSEYRFVRRDGTVRFIESQGSIVRDGKGEPAKVVVVSRDITDRKKAEEARRETETRYRTLVEQAPDGIFIGDEGGRLLLVNPKACTMLGYSEEELLGLSIRDTWPADDAHFVNERLRAIQPGATLHFERNMRRKDGSQFPVEISLRKLQDGRLQEFIRDVSDRQRAEASIVKLLRAVEQTDEVIFMTDRDGVITYTNPAFEEVYGFSSKEAFGKTPRILKSSRMAPDFYTKFWSDLLSGKSVRGELINRTKDGRDLTVVASVNPVLDPQGKITGFIAVQNDITEQKNIEVEKRNLQMQLVQAQKLESIGTLAGGIAHDFNNILGIVSGYASILESLTENRPKLAQSAEAIRKAGDRGANLVRQILTFARKTDVMFEPLSANEIIKELAKMLEQTFPKTIAVSLQLDEEIPAINADRTQLHQALLNFCVNARDAMPDGGNLAIRTETVSGGCVRKKFRDAQGEQYVHLSVSDTGTGMDEATRSRIFEPFFTTKEQGKGTGLGLAVVYGIVNSHQGQIEVETEVGKGTTFHVYFPSLTHFGDMLEQLHEEEGEVPTGNETILLVEDEEMLRELLRMLLEEKGYTVLLAADGEEAVEMYSKNRDRVALVLTDLGLPKLGGLEALKKMMRIDPGLKAVVASGYLEPMLRDQIVKAGAKRMVQKPYQPNEILRAIRDVIDNVHGGPSMHGGLVHHAAGSDHPV